MTAIDRRPGAAAERDHDVIIVGGGIHGVCHLEEAARAGLRAVLVERDDFGGATSANSLRIVHGGLRYLQSLDLTRFRQSVGERRWFLRRFPDLVRPLACLMPLHGGIRRPSIFRVAATLNDVLSRHRNDGVRDDARLPRAGVVDRERTIELFGRVDQAHLLGGGVWHDATITSPQRIVMTLLRSASAMGAVALNYVAAEEIVVAGGVVRGLVARDRTDDSAVRLRAPAVINTAGPWMPALTTRWSAAEPPASATLAFNLLLDRPPLAEMALAVQPRTPDARSYFLVPWRGRIMAGTGYVALRDGDLSARPAEQHVTAFLEDLNQAIPGLALEHADVLSKSWGVQPACGPGETEPAARDRRIDHARLGGPDGLVSVCGVKYTTARAVAERTIELVRGRLGEAASRPRRDDWTDDAPFEAELVEPTALLGGADLGDRLRRLVEEEAVLHLDDLILRRTDWGADPTTVIAAAERAAALLDWSPSRRDVAMSRLRAQVDASTVTMTSAS